MIEVMFKYVRKKWKLMESQMNPGRKEGNWNISQVNIIEIKLEQAREWNSVFNQELKRKMRRYINTSMRVFRFLEQKPSSGAIQKILEISYVSNCAEVSKLKLQSLKLQSLGLKPVT